MTGSDEGAKGWTNYAPVDDPVSGTPESSGGVSGAVSAVGEGSPHVLALLALAVLILLAAAAVRAARVRRRRI
jgi:hypothetical protein